MKKSSKIWLITAAALIFVGLTVFALAMTMLNWDFSRLNNNEYVTNTVEISDNFDSLSIDAITDDISFQLSDNNKCKVVCYEQEKMVHTAVVNDKTLEIKVHDMRKWYEYISFSFDCPKITVYLPQKSYSALRINADTGKLEIPGDLSFNTIDINGATGDVHCNASSKVYTKIKLSTGNIAIDGVSSGEMDLSASTGGIRVGSVSCKGDISVKVSTGTVLLRDINCKNLTSDGSTGSIDLNHVIASQTFSLERSTGNVTLAGCDAGELFIKTSTGDVTGTLLSEKVFLTDTSTGEISVPKTMTGGKCEITTSTGNIRIGIKE